MDQLDYMVKGLGGLGKDGKVEKMGVDPIMSSPDNP